MCIKLVYLRSLVKSAARKFCFGKKPTRIDENVEDMHYYKDELSKKVEVADHDPQEKRFVEIGHSQPEVPRGISDENRVIAVIDEIMSIECPDEPYKTPALNLWKIASTWKLFRDLDVEAQAAACLHIVASHEFVLNRDISTYLRAPQEDLVQSRKLAFRVFSIRREIEWILQLYTMEDRDAAMDIAILLMERKPDVQNSGSLAIAAGYIALSNQGYSIELESMIPVLDPLMAPRYRNLAQVKSQYAQGRKDIEMLVAHFLNAKYVLPSFTDCHPINM